MGKEAESEWQVVQVWRNLNEGVEKSRWEQGEEWLDGQEGIGRDPRVAGMGWRFVAKKGEERKFSLNVLFDLEGKYSNG